jgi:membrane protease YdiL (CAAX protease family)
MSSPDCLVPNPGAENPPWSGLDLLIVGLVLVAALFLFSSISFLIVLHSSASHGMSAAELGKNPGPLVIVPAMTLAYLAMLVAMYGLVTRHGQRPFWQTVGWRWPGNPGWLGFLAAGGFLAVALGEISRLLPIPKSLPMDKFFQNRQGAYLMMIFGVAIAPVAEEMLFRGFLYPVLDRWLQTLFMTPRQLRRGCIWILIMAAWGYLEHRLPLAWSILLAVVAFLGPADAAGRNNCGLGAGSGSDFCSCFRNRYDGAVAPGRAARSVQHGAGPGNPGGRQVGPFPGGVGDQLRFCHGA